MHDLQFHEFTLPEIDSVFSGDSRQLAFRVVDSEGDGVDITSATVEWSLFNRAYQDDAADAVITGDDASVELVTDNRVNSEDGEWEVRISPEATEGNWGSFYHRPVVTDADGNRSSWRGELVLTV